MLVTRFGLYAVLMALTGLAAFPLYALRSHERDAGTILPLRKPLLWLAGLALVLSLAGGLVLVASMSGGELLRPDMELVGSLLMETPLGAAWILRIGALLGVFALLLTLLQSGGALWSPGVVGASVIALGSLAWTGHAGSGEGWHGAIWLASDIIHMLAAAIWLGGIAAFILLLRGASGSVPSERLAVAQRALRDFARTGTICVAAIVATGILNAYLVFAVSPIAAIPKTQYGQVLAAKLVLVAVMLLLAARNRWQLTPMLESNLENREAQNSASALRTNVLVEAGAGLIVLGLVAWLGTLDPMLAAGAG